ncbi:hypothetical protein [Buchnera aphidicola]|uniref:hypothetical protein n=1 Tax=Buchnera aphidicola TaxID=9 RepID=UPI003BEEC6A2
MPNTKKIGNAGSFFKNPIIPLEQAQKIIALYKNIPFYPQKNGYIKISAAWLIKKYQFNDIKIGGASIYKKNKLILINKNKALPKDIINLAKIIQKCIKKKFNIILEPEVYLIDSLGNKKSLQEISF